MEEYVSYGIVSILPVITILTIAVLTRRTLFAMCCGLTVAVIILTDSVVGLPGLWFDYCCRSMANETAQWLIMIIAMFGVLIKLYEKSNAVIDFGMMYDGDCGMYTLIAKLMSQKSTNFASEFAAIKDKTTAHYKEVLDMFAKLS